MVASRTPYLVNNHKVIFGAIIVSGFAPGNFLEISALSDYANSIVNTDGAVSTNIVANKTARAVLKINYDSPINKLLRAACELFPISGIKLPFTSVNALDPLDTTFSATSYIERPSTDTYSENSQDMIRTYNFFLDYAIRV